VILAASVGSDLAFDLFPALAPIVSWVGDSVDAADRVTTPLFPAATT
jgi:hypothetical protein